MGHDHAVQVARTQPAKLAAMEGLFQTTQGAALTLWGFPDVKNETVYVNIGVPKMLSFLVDFDFNSTIQGLTEFPAPGLAADRRRVLSVSVHDFVRRTVRAGSLGGAAAG